MDRETNKKLSQKISREEAIKIFGEEIVKEAEQEQIMKAKENNQINLEKQQLINEALEAIDNKRITLELEIDEKAKNYEQSYTQGRSDGYAGRAKAKNTPGYNAGYVIGQKLREAENEPDKSIERKEELFEEDTPRHR